MRGRTIATALVTLVVSAAALTVIPIDPIKPIPPIINPSYPRVDVTPRSPVDRDDVTLKLVLGTDCCNPRYATSSKIVHHQIACITTPCPQQYEIELTYSVSDPCACIMIYPAPSMEIGPTFSLGALNAGIYTVLGDGDTVGAFTVYDHADSARGHTLSGIVMTDPSPLKIASMPISGAKVYLKQPVEYWYMTNQIAGTDDLMPIAPTPIYRIIDSATTGSDGAFKFSDLADDMYQLAAGATGYQSATVSVKVDSDTSVTMVLIPANASAGVTGTVTDVNMTPLAQCTVTVTFADCWNIVPLDPTLITLDTNVAYLEGGAQAQTNVIDPGYAPCPVYTAVTDKSGDYTISGIVLTKNDQPINVIARKKGYATAVKSATLSNKLTATVDFVLEEQYSNEDSTFSGDVVFVVRTEKAAYTRGEFLNIRYTIYNNSSSAVTYGSLSSSCKFDYVLTDGDDAVVYHLLSNVACTDDISQLTVAAGDSVTKSFSAYYLRGAYTSLTVTVKVAGHTATEASVAVTVDQPTSFAAEPRNAVKIHRIASVKDGWVKLDLPRAQDVSIQVFSVSGRVLATPLPGRMLRSGRHMFLLPGSSAAHGVAVVRVQGEDFAVTEKVGRVRR